MEVALLLYQLALASGFDPGTLITPGTATGSYNDLYELGSLYNDGNA
jgi:hypothetical protein